MKLLQFAVSSVVGATTGSHVTKTSSGTSQPESVQYRTLQTRTSILQTLRNNVASVSKLASRLVAANRERLQRNRDVGQILQLNAHYLKDIGLTYNDLADLRSGQKSLEGLNAMRSESEGFFNLRLKEVETSKIEASDLKAANQEPGEFASCG